MNKYMVCILAFTTFITGFIFIECEKWEDSREKYYAYMVDTGQDDIVGDDFTYRLNSSEILKSNLYGYFQVKYRDDGRISYYNYYSKSSIDDTTISEGVKQDSQYKWRSITRFSYDENGRLSESESTSMKTKFQYIDNRTASYITTDKNYGLSEIRGIVKFNDRNELISEETIYSNGKKEIKIIEYLDNKKIVQNAYAGLTEKYETEYKNGEIVRIEYSNNRGESRIQEKKDWKLPLSTPGK